jgi:hypothetical protein
MEPEGSLPHSQVPATCLCHSDTNTTKISYLQMLYIKNLNAYTVKLMHTTD